MTEEEFKGLITRKELVYKGKEVTHGGPEDTVNKRTPDSARFKWGISGRVARYEGNGYAAQSLREIYLDVDFPKARNTKQLIENDFSQQLVNGL
ncbi:MAG: hypothetical protein ACOYNL_04920 [Rickettsiales bacterium]